METRIAPVRGLFLRRGCRSGSRAGSGKKPRKRSKHEDNPQQEWLATIRGEKDVECFSTFDYAAPLTEMVLLGNLAVPKSSERSTGMQRT